MGRDVSFVEAIKLAFKNYFKFSGRAQRAEYWWFYLFTIIGGIVLSILDMIIFGIEDTSVDLAPLSDGFALLTLIPTLSLGWRRMHDIGKSGLWSFLPLLPVTAMVLSMIPMFGAGGDLPPLAIGGVIIFGLLTLASFIYVIVLLATDSQRETNRFGPSPKYGSQADVFS